MNYKINENHKIKVENVMKFLHYLPNMGFFFFFFPDIS